MRADARGLGPAVTAVVALFGAALLGALRTSSTDVRGRFSTAAWQEVLGDPVLWEAALFTAWVTVAVVGLGLPLAVAAAAVLRRARLVRLAFDVPVLLPHLLAATVAVFWLAEGGVADRLLDGLPVQLVRDRAGLGVIGVYLYKEVPFLALLLVAAWDEDTDDRLEAAATLGASRATALRHVLWPVLRAPAVVGALLVAAFTFGSFEVPLVVGPTTPPTIAVFALERTRTASLTGQSEAAAVLLLAALVALVLAALALRTARGADR